MISMRNYLWYSNSMSLPEMDVLPTDHREFIGATSIELGYGIDATDSQFFEYRPNGAA